MFYIFRGLSLLHAARRLPPGARPFSTTVVAAAGAQAFRRLATITPTLGLGAYVVTADEPKQVAYLAAFAPVRLARDVVAAVSILAGRAGGAQGG